MAGKQSSYRWLFLAALLSVGFVLGACGSDFNDAQGQENGAEVESGTVEPPELDQELSFSRPAEPFENEVIAVLDGEQMNVVDVTTGEVLASTAATIEPLFANATSDGGVVYITDERSPGLRQLIRVDAGGFETLEFESTGWIDHRLTTDGPALVTRDDEADTQFLRFRLDGLIDRYTFGQGMFIDAFGDTIALTPADRNGDVWFLDSDMTVIEGADGSELEVDRPAVERTETGLVHEFGDRWMTELDGEVLTITGPDGETVVERPADSITNVDVFAHPTNNNALITLRTCVSREGPVCPINSTDDTNEGAGEEEAGDEPYVAPGYLEVYLFDMSTTELQLLEMVPTSSIAALEVESGWFVASVDGSTTTLVSISNDGVVENFQGPTTGALDFTMEFVVPVAPGVLALQDFQATGVFFLTEDGIESAPGTAVVNKEWWRQFAGQFDHLG